MKNLPIKEKLDEFKTFNETHEYDDSNRANFYLGLKYHTKKNSESDYTLNEEIP